MLAEAHWCQAWSVVAQSRRGLVEWLCESQTDLCGEKYIVMGNELQAELILCTAFCCFFLCKCKCRAWNCCRAWAERISSTVCFCDTHIIFAQNLLKLAQSSCQDYGVICENVSKWYRHPHETSKWLSVSKWISWYQIANPTFKVTISVHKINMVTVSKVSKPRL